MRAPRGPELAVERHDRRPVLPEAAFPQIDAGHVLDVERVGALAVYDDRQRLLLRDGGHRHEQGDRRADERPDPPHLRRGP